MLTTDSRELLPWAHDTPLGGRLPGRRSGRPGECDARYVSRVPSAPLVNALVPFSTRLADDGLVHVRAWAASPRPVLIVAELDWAVLVADRQDAYFGPGIYTYPGYAIGAALAACSGMDPDPVIIARLPDPPGERLLRVVDVEDPEGWEPVTYGDVASMLGGAVPPAPPPGAYVPRVVEAWVRDGALPA